MTSVIVRPSPVKYVEWEGDSREVVRTFPSQARLNLGADLRRLQQGKDPENWCPMPSIAPGVGELKDQDEKTWYRVIYYTKVKGMIYVLHAFEKTSRKTEKRNRRTAEQRLKALLSRLRREGKL